MGFLLRRVEVRGLLLRGEAVGRRIDLELSILRWEEVYGESVSEPERDWREKKAGLTKKRAEELVVPIDADQPSNSASP